MVDRTGGVRVAPGAAGRVAGPVDLAARAPAAPGRFDSDRCRPSDHDLPFRRLVQPGSTHVHSWRSAGCALPAGRRTVPVWRCIVWPALAGRDCLRDRRGGWPVHSLLFRVSAGQCQPADDRAAPMALACHRADRAARACHLARCTDRRAGALCALVADSLAASD